MLEPDAGPPRCPGDALLQHTFSTGPYGTDRHDVADDVTVDLFDGTTFTLSEHWTGCDSYVFLPDTLTVSATDATSLWDFSADIAELVAASPDNVHYFFVSRRSNDTTAEVNINAMAERVTDVIDGLDTEDAAHWGERLHVVATRAGALDNWLAGVLQSGVGIGGFAIDRQQTIRGVGSLADVTRYTGAAGWPWNDNLAYAAHEPRRYNYEAARQERLDAEEATVVTLWSGDVLAEFADTTVTLPTAAEMAAFDTLEIDVTMRCPDFGSIEFSNCGAWDYIASFFVYDDVAAAWIELGRYITSYHREGRLTVDATPMLVHLLAGGSRTFRWSFAPTWNTQPTATWLDLRFTNGGKGYAPAEGTFLWTGGPFNSAYNTIHAPVDVAIPGDAARVELWAIITGHGGATSNCAEFCNHQHEFTVNGNVYLHDHPAIGNDQGCVEEIQNGAVPNQWGTWWFGRGGWCPGQQVEPFVADVTGDVTPGATATLGYRGLFFGTDPPDDSGDIAMVSYLVVYR